MSRRIRRRELLEKDLRGAQLLGWGLTLFAAGVVAMGVDWYYDFQLIGPALVGMWAALVGLVLLAWGAGRLLGDPAAPRPARRRRERAVAADSKPAGDRMAA